MANLEQAAALIVATGADVTYFLEGEPGIGKSSVLALVAERLGDGYVPVTVDCPLIDVVDFAIPYVEGGIGRLAPSELWRPDDPRPRVIMLDELPKAPPTVKPMFTRLMLDRCIGARPLPAGSIVFATGNAATDGVGDVMQAHISNRLTRISVTKPRAAEWIAWASRSGVSPVVMSAVHRLPHVFQSYKDEGGDNNPYIFNPKKNTAAFASPRSLAKAGHICDQRDRLGRELTLEALEGTVGASFARDLVAWLDLVDTVPSWDDILGSPADCMVPDSAGARLLLIFGSASILTRANAAAFVAYFSRLETEERVLWGSLFKTRLGLVMQVPAFAKMMVRDGWVLA